MSNLLPCPFCGGKAALRYDSGNDRYPQSWDVVCDVCRVAFPASYGSSTWKVDTALDKLAMSVPVNAWNRRSLHNAEREVVEAAMKVCAGFGSLRELNKACDALAKLHNPAPPADPTVFGIRVHVVPDFPDGGALMTDGKNAVALIDRAAPPAQEASQWLPIESAPNGMTVLVWQADRGGVCDVAWRDNGTGLWWCDFDGHEVYPAPTHWMPLPAPPAAPEERE